MKHFFTTFTVSIFVTLLLSGCTHTQNNLFTTSYKEKLLKIQSIVENYYIEDIKLDSLIKDKNYTKEEFLETVKTIEKKLDRYSSYGVVNSKLIQNKKERYHTKVIENTLYIKIAHFEKGISKKVAQSLHNYQNSVTKIELDLRDNTGGVFSEAVKIVDMFIDKGIIVSLKQKHNTKTYLATQKATLSALPITILINHKTASSAEIVAGVLQDLQRATLVGEKTYGKGVVQSLIYLDETRTDYIYITTAKYFLPSGRSVGSGLSPNLTQCGEL